MTRNPRFYTFEEWLKAHPQVKDVEDCDVCNGTGRHVCDCGDEHDCGECDGKGEIDHTKEIYADMVARQKREYDQYLKSVEAA